MIDRQAPRVAAISLACRKISLPIDAIAADGTMVAQAITCGGWMHPAIRPSSPRVMGPGITAVRSTAWPMSGCRRTAMKTAGFATKARCRSHELAQRWQDRALRLGIVKAKRPRQPPDGRLRRWSALSREAVITVEAQIGRISRYVHATERWERTVFVVTSDHGEEFFRDMAKETAFTAHHPVTMARSQS